MIYGLVGRKLGHSFSVPIHRHMGCEDYALYELEPEALGDFLRRPDIGGLNVTIPYKQDVIPLLDRVDDAAREIGAVNTVVNRNGALWGFNTDKYGFEYAAKSAGIDFSGKKTVILGSGGTSRTARAAAKALGAGEIVVVSRSGEDNYENLSRHADAAILVNTTPVGMSPNCPDAPVSLKAFPNLTGVFDVIFNPLKTALVLEAEARGIPHADSLMMLTAQAKAAEELFFGKTIDDAVIDDFTQTLRRDALNIVLIGMPGCGKTTVGRMLSRMTGRPLVDMDQYIAGTEGRSPAELISSLGEDAFRRIETAALREVTKKSGQIITTGGGVVTREENYVLLHQNGRVYCLTRSLDQLSTRNRPLSQGPDALRNLLRVRKPLYQRFMDVKISNAGPVRVTAERIWRNFNAYSGH